MVHVEKDKSLSGSVTLRKSKKERTSNYEEIREY